MAHMNQERKAKIAPVIKEICKRYGVKASLSVHNHSTLVLTVKSGGIDFIGNYNKVVGDQMRNIGRLNDFHAAKDHIDVNTYWQHEHFSGKAFAFLKEAKSALLGPDYFDHSDAQTDYFHCSHYISIYIGRWDKPYRYESAECLIAA